MANEHQGDHYANVIYVGASPVCAKNFEAYARRQADAFYSGRSAPDLAAEDYEVNFKAKIRHFKSQLTTLPIKAWLGLMKTSTIAHRLILPKSK